MDFQEAYQMFLEYEDAKGYSPRTIESYALDSRSFLKFLNEKDLPQAVDLIDHRVLRRYNVWLKQQGYSVGTIGRRLDSMSSFLNFMEREDIIPTNPMKRVYRPKPDERIPVFLTREEVDRLLRVVDNSPGVNWARDRAILRILIYMGLRRSELSALDWDQVDFHKGTITIRHAKGNRDRIVPMNAEVQECLWEYLQTRLPLTNPAVAVNRYQQRMDRDCLSRIIRKAVSKTSISKHVTPHVFRHTCASLLIEAGVDIVTVAQILGHRDIQTTTIYTHTSPKRLIDGVNRLCSKKTPSTEKPNI